VELLEAAEAGDNARVQNLLDVGAKVNAKGKGGMTPLLVAVTNNHADTVKLLLDTGVSTFSARFVLIRFALGGDLTA
jgi:ankyrin repeat protein